MKQKKSIKKLLPLLIGTFMIVASFTVIINAASIVNNNGSSSLEVPELYIDKKVLDTNGLNNENKEAQWVEEIEVNRGDKVTFKCEFGLSTYSDQQQTFNPKFQNCVIRDYLPPVLGYVSSEYDVDTVSSVVDIDSYSIDGPFYDGIKNIVEWKLSGNGISKITFYIQAKVKDNIPSKDFISDIYVNTFEYNASIITTEIDFDGQETPDDVLIKLTGSDTARIKLIRIPGIDIEKKVRIYGETENKDWQDKISAPVGTTLEFLIMISNIGDYEIKDVLVADQLSEEIFKEPEEELLWNIESLGIGESREITFTVDLIREGEGFNYVEVTGVIDREEIVSDEFLLERIVALPEIIENQPPVLSFETPPNNSDDVSIDLSELSVIINDPEGDLFNWAIKSPEGQDFIDGVSAQDETNGTKICPINAGRLQPDTEYSWIVLAHDVEGSGEEISAEYRFKTESYQPPQNQSPEITNEYPENGAENVPITVSELLVTITDPEDDLIDWTIEVFTEGTDIGFACGYDDLGGVKVCNIPYDPTCDLDYDTNYVWYVNATDYGSGEKTSKVFTFTTESAPNANNSPVIHLPDPEDGEVDISTCISELNVTIEDPENDLFDWSIETCPDVGEISIRDDSNGVKSLPIQIRCALDYETTYTWYVNATDQGSGETSSEIFTFTTESAPADNHDPDQPTNQLPEDGMTDVDMPTDLCVHVTDPDGDSMDVSFYIRRQGLETFNLIDTISTANDTDVCVTCNDLSYLATYEWYVIIKDTPGKEVYSSICEFTTVEDEIPEENHIPDAPIHPNPENEEINVDLNPILSVEVNDLDGDLLDVYFYDASDDSLIGFDEDVESGTRAAILWSDLENSSVYTWYVVVNDTQSETTSEIWSFSTFYNGLLPEILITKPLPVGLYLRDRLIEFIPVEIPLILGPITIEAQVIDHGVSITDIKIMVDDEVLAAYDYDSDPEYVYNCTWYGPALGWYPIKVAAYNNDILITSTELEVFALIIASQ